MAKYNSIKPSYLLALITLIFLSSCGSTNTQSLFKSQTDIDPATIKDIYVVNDRGQPDFYYRIREADVISIRNLQNKEWGVTQSIASGTTSTSNVAATNTIDPTAISYIVDNEGFVNLPVLGKVKLTGLTRKEAALKIQELFAAKSLVNPIIELNIVNLKVTLLGEFTKTGNFPLTKDNTRLYEVIAEAGISKSADPRTLKIVRGLKPNEEIIYVNLTNESVLNNNKLILQNNDVITIGLNKNALDGEKIQRFNNIIQPLLVIVNLAILIFTLSK